MIEYIKKLNLSELDRTKAIILVKNIKHGGKYLEQLLNTCFLIIPNFNDKYYDKFKENKTYQILLKYDNYKRSIAFKVMLDKISSEEDSITINKLDKIFKSLCNHKAISMGVSIDKYKIYADTISNIDIEAIEWVESILTSNSILKLDEKEYEMIAEYIKIVASRNKKGEVTFDDNGNWDLLKADYHQIKAYKKIFKKR